MSSDPAAVKYAELLGDWLEAEGYTHCFLVAGGGCMHLIDGFRTRFVCIPVVRSSFALGRNAGTRPNEGRSP